MMDNAQHVDEGEECQGEHNKTVPASVATGPMHQFDGWRPEISREGIVRRGKVPRFDGCSLMDWHKRHDKQAATAPHGLTRSITRAEVERHNQMDDMWMVMEGVVYDVTVFQMYHPGGEAILRACAGKDITDLYKTYHKWVSCENTIGNFALGLLAEDPQVGTDG